MFDRGFQLKSIKDLPVDFRLNLRDIFKIETIQDFQSYASTDSGRDILCRNLRLEKYKLEEYIKIVDGHTKANVRHGKDSDRSPWNLVGGSGLVLLAAVAIAGYKSTHNPPDADISFNHLNGLNSVEIQGTVKYDEKWGGKQPSEINLKFITPGEYSVKVVAVDLWISHGRYNRTAGIEKVDLNFSKSFTVSEPYPLTIKREELPASEGILEVTLHKSNNDKDKTGYLKF